MKYFAYALVVGIAPACSPNTKDSKTVNKKLSVEEQNIVYARVGRTINHGKCYENGIDINPIIKINASTINHGEAFSGKAYFPTPYFNKLAKCYSFTYKSRLAISTMLMPIGAHGQNQDTIFFEVSPDSLNKVKQGKTVDEYEMEARLRASFSDGISGYDTTGAATKVRLFVRKH
jgi:hypothetical protein